MYPINPQGYQLRPVHEILRDVAAIRMNKPEAYASLRIVPDQPTDDTYQTFTIQRSAIFGNSNVDATRTEGSRFKSPPGFEVDSITGDTKEYGLGVKLDARKVARSPFPVRAAAIGDLVTHLATARELRTYEALFTAANWPSSFVAPTPWTNAAAQAMDDLQDAADLVSGNGGSVNRVVLTWAAAKALARNDGIKSFLPTTIDRNKITRPQIQTMIAEAIGQDLTPERVFILDLIYNDSVPGAAANLIRFGGANRWAWVGHIDDEPVTSQVVDGVQAQITTNATALLRLQTDPIKVVTEEYPTKRYEELVTWHGEALQIVTPQYGCRVAG